MFDRQITSELAQRKPLGEIVFEAICDSIVSGRIKSGEWLRQEDISEELGVSHTPVRQALERLVAEGLAERVPYKGVRVTELGHEEIAELYALRALLEPLVVRLATPHLSAPDLQTLTAIIDEMDTMVTLDQMYERRNQNRRFHLAISNACQNVSLAWLYEMVFNKCPGWLLYEGMFRQEDLASSRLQAETAEHRAILEAIAARDANLAERKTVECLRYLTEDLADLFGISLELLQQKQREVWPRLDNLQTE